MVMEEAFVGGTLHYLNIVSSMTNWNEVLRDKDGLDM
jgi:hypothetical protein